MSKSNTLIPKTNLPTSWRKAVSPVMNGTTFSVCSIFWNFKIFIWPVSAQAAALRPCRKGWYKQIKKKKMNECLQNQNQCGIWYRRLSIGLQQRWVRVHLTAPGILAAQSSSLDLTGVVKPVARDSNDNAASSSQVRRPEVNPSSSAGAPVAKTKNFMWTRLSHHNMTIFPNNVDTLEKVDSNLRQKLGRQPNGDMLEIDVNMMIWGMFMSATMKAAVHLGPTYKEHLSTTKNMDFDQIKHLFDTSRKLIMDQDQEMYGIPMIDGNTIPWVRSSLLNDRAVELSTAKVYVFSDSVLCPGGRDYWIPTNSEVLERENQSIVNWTVLIENQSCSSGNFSKETARCSYFKKSEKTMEANTIRPEEFEDRIIFMSMYNDIDWR